MTRSLWGLALLVVVSAPACGGKVVFEQSEGGAGGASSSVNTASTSPSGNGCPSFPNIQGSCDLSEGTICPLPFGCCGGHAICSGGVWGYQADACDAACIACSPNLSCLSQPGIICLHNETSTIETWECRQDLCSDQTNQCICDEPLCDESSLHCGGYSPGYLMCHF
jgi:hypothetical protein